MRLGRTALASIAFSLQFVVATPLATAETLFKTAVDLGEGVELRINESEDGLLTVTVTTDGQVSESYSIANALTDEASIQQHKFCAACEPVYFVPAYDRSSTYGATTGIVVWSDPWWRLAILPLTRPFAEDNDGDGVSEIVDYTVVDQQEHKTVYRFDNGFLVKQE